MLRLPMIHLALSVAFSLFAVSSFGAVDAQNRLFFEGKDGPGKGKTTAALGTAFRAAGTGMRVLVLQFLKGSWHYGELDAVKAFGDKFIMKQMGRGFVKVGAEKPDPEDVRMVEDGRSA